MSFFVVDGSGFIFRAYYALPSLTRDDGTPVGAVVGFCNMLLRLIDEHKPSNLVVVFDAGRRTFRHDMYAEYKANRGEAPEDLVPQFPLIREACRAFSIPYIEKEGYEADDLIASLVKAEGSATVVSSDKDLYQLVSDRVRLFDPMKNTYINADFVEKKLGVPPHQVRDLLALSGDASDNIPGVPGIGPKTAAILLKAYSSLDGIYTQLPSISQAKRQQTLQKNKELAYISQRLVTLKDDIPVASIDTYAFDGVDTEAGYMFCKDQGFRALTARFTPQIKYEQKEIKTAEELALWWENNTGSCAVFLGISKGDALGIALAKSDANACFIPFSHHYILQSFFEDRTICKVGYDIKQLKQYCAPFPIEPYEDMRIKAHLVGVSTENLSASLPGDIASLQERACALWSLYNSLSIKGVASLYYRVELPLVEVLSAMEHRGICIDIDKLQAMEVAFSESLKGLEEEAYALAGEMFNLGSPKQLGSVLFDHLGLPASKKSKTGQYVTDADVLESLAHEYPIAAIILKWRHLAKLKSTYTHSLIQEAVDGRIHTSYGVAHTSTGRLSSFSPNLQNIPIRSALGREIRKAFVATPGYKLISFDYSQIELRLLAHVADIKPLKDAFCSGLDVHALTASRVFSVPLDCVSSEQRHKAKAINFGIIYGISGYGLARQLGVGVKEAQSYIDRYKKEYTGLEDYMEERIREARCKGYVTTLLGRRCYVPDITSSLPHKRQFAERQAINAPLQGSNADIIKQAMVRIYEKLRHTNAHMLLQVHDELVFEVPEEEVNQWIETIRSLMDFPLSVPIVVNVETALRWGDMH